MISTLSARTSLIPSRLSLNRTENKGTSTLYKSYSDIKRVKGYRRDVATFGMLTLMEWPTNNISMTISFA